MGVGAGASLAACGESPLSSASAEVSATGAVTETAEVVVVGAELAELLAGLMAARQLTTAGKNVLVLEARDRVGGRTLNRAVTAAGATPGTIEQSSSEEEFSRGCCAGYFPPGVWLDYGEALRAPIGRLHWAGTETAEVRVGRDLNGILRLRP